MLPCVSGEEVEGWPGKALVGATAGAMIQHACEAIEAGLKFSETGGTPHISRYDIREFVY